MPRRGEHLGRVVRAARHHRHRVAFRDARVLRGAHRVDAAREPRGARGARVPTHLDVHRTTEPSAVPDRRTARQLVVLRLLRAHARLPRHARAVRDRSRCVRGTRRGTRACDPVHPRGSPRRPSAPDRARRSAASSAGRADSSCSSARPRAVLPRRRHELGPLLHDGLRVRRELHRLLAAVPPLIAEIPGAPDSLRRNAAHAASTPGDDAEQSLPRDAFRKQRLDHVAHVWNHPPRRGGGVALDLPRARRVASAD